jgi:hypothetical protein
MNGFDILKYAALLAKVFQLEEKIRQNPPESVEEYAAAVFEVKALWDEIHAMITSGNVTPGDIQAAHLRNQALWTVAVPAGGQYGIAFNPPVPDDEELLARGFETGDYVVTHWQVPQWKVLKTADADPQWLHLRRIGEN